MAEERRPRILLWVVIGGAGFFVFVLAVFTLVYLAMRGQSGDYYTSRAGTGGKIGIVDIEGVIWTPKDHVKALKKFADDDSVKAIIVHLNTPGGGAAASEEIYREVKRIRDEKKKHIVASIETVGASGGYYVASATKKIYANQASVVGSIGVIMEWYNYGDLLRWMKLHNVIIKAGELKDTGDPMRPLTPQEKAYLQGMVDNMHGQFIHAVASGRGVKDDDIKPLATGRVWTGQQALPLKLIDEIADFEAVVKETAKAVGIKGEPTLVRPTRERRTLLDLLFSDVSDLIPDRAKLLESNVGFYYLWK